jgi:hypothetical protein
VLKHYLTLKLEIQIFITDKGKAVVEVHDEKWLWDLAVLCDTIHHINDIPNLKVNRNSFLMCLRLSELLK